MILTVTVPSWEIEGDGREFVVGRETCSWLDFEEDARDTPHVQQVDGVAKPLEDWPGVGFGRQPVRIDVGSAALYWEAPGTAEGPVRLRGRITTNTMDAPEDFPETVGVVRRVRMVWRDDVMGEDRAWVSGAVLRYEDVAASYVPVLPVRPVDPVAEERMRRRAQREFKRRVPLARRLRGETFHVTLPGDTTLPPAPGETEAHFQGAVIDLEVTGTM